MLHKRWRWGLARRSIIHLKGKFYMAADSCNTKHTRGFAINPPASVIREYIIPFIFSLSLAYVSRLIQLSVLPIICHRYMDSSSAGKAPATVEQDNFSNERKRERQPMKMEQSAGLTWFYCWSCQLCRNAFTVHASARRWFRRIHT